MCNEVARRIALGEIRDDFAERRIPLRFPEGLPNLAPEPGIRITDRTLIVRAGGEAVVRRWSWPGPGGRPVYNYRSDGRDLRAGRCLIPVDGFYEFTAPSDATRKRKDKWMFTRTGAAWFCLAGIWRADAAIGEAFAILTTEPGPDVAPFHARQVVVIERADWAGWLDGSAPSGDMCRGAAAGTLSVAPAQGCFHGRGRLSRHHIITGSVRCAFPP